MGGIRITLSNGQKSPLFKTNYEMTGPEIIDINQELKPKKFAVKANWAIYEFKLTDNAN